MSDYHRPPHESYPPPPPGYGSSYPPPPPGYPSALPHEGYPPPLPPPPPGYAGYPPPQPPYSSYQGYFDNGYPPPPPPPQHHHYQHVEHCHHHDEPDCFSFLRGCFTRGQRRTKELETENKRDFPFKQTPLRSPLFEAKKSDQASSLDVILSRTCTNKNKSCSIFHESTTPRQVAPPPSWPLRVAPPWLHPESCVHPQVLPVDHSAAASPEIEGFTDLNPAYSHSPSESAIVENRNDNGNGYDADEGVFVSDGPVLSPSTEMEPEEGYALREWHR
ncbi:hypothetical protein Fmac_015490 [Flemingia macrophylla]|uniref:Uncharacterized protein n=1 Tax=Flemingia macrophylla TaxID=520843 RepID=A0ABD1MFB7_9FABA